MKLDNIEICGILSKSELKDYNINYPYREVCKSYDLVIPPDKPDMECILQAFVDAYITNWKTIHTDEGLKIFLEAYFYTKILFVSNSSSQSIHSTEFHKPFCTLLPINSNASKFIRPNIFITEAFIKELSPRNFCISSLMLVHSIVDTNNNYIDTKELSIKNVPDKKIYYTNKNNINSNTNNIDLNIKKDTPNFDKNNINLNTQKNNPNFDKNDINLNTQKNNPNFNKNDINLNTQKSNPNFNKNDINLNTQKNNPNKNNINFNENSMSLNIDYDMNSDESYFEIDWE